MDTRESLVESLSERIEAYSKTTFELSKLKLLETTTTVVTSVVPKIGVVVMFSVFVLTLSVGVALYLGEILGKSYYGFFIVAGFYLLCGLIIYFFLHQWIKKPLSNIIIKQALQ